MTAFATLLSVIIVTLVSYAYVKNAGAVLDLTERFVDRVADSGMASTVALLDPVAAHVRSMAEVATEDEAKARDGSLFPYLMSLLDSSPQLQSIYYAFEADGRFLQAFPIPPGTEKFGANNNPPPHGAQFALRVVDRKGGVYSDVWTYVRRDGTVLGRETSNQLNYDHRTRDWYKEVVAKRSLIWTDLVVFTSNRQAGIAAAYPIIAKDGRVIGATAANISTRQLSDFMSKLELGSGGIGMIVDEKDQLIAHPDASKVVRQDGLKLSLVKAAELNDIRVSDAFAAYHATRAKFLRFNSGGMAYLGSFRELPDDFGKKWLLGVVVLEDDFVGTLKSNTRDIVLVGLALMVLGMVGMTVISRWISKPLARLSGEIRKIQKFDLAGPIAIHAWVREVNELIDSLNMMKRALRTFGMFVPRDLVRELVASGRTIELGGQDRTLTVMFTDIADFTGLSERMEAGDLLVHVSRHLAAMSQCIGQEDGTVDKYIGDAVMAFWGAPAWREDHALRGCIAALRAQQLQSALNAEWEADGLPTMFVRIGLHTANVIVGNIGSEQRMSYTAVGDGVNVASRLEGVNKVYGTKICISAAVAQAAGDSLLIRPLDLVAVKGRKAGEMVFELVGLRQGPPELLATHDQIEMCRTTEAAFNAYRARQWDQAISLYQTLGEKGGGAKLAALFVERCKAYQAAPPPADWTGVHELKSK
ncbi:adenylate/guanylate cyclase domain-containing protein [Paramagnetospirillum marisnigri]|uniref:adenylate/guanylate cyclase domain-containing protein n=1 Tax=Paramagnetospirillum marisnigri TaxID=1285242 RepID=UPI001FE23E1A|nr:adenylate/guanylate cyclase domain-containing protein [Paramagnetospirillum marisnigri]